MDSDGKQLCCRVTKYRKFGESTWTQIYKIRSHRNLAAQKRQNFVAVFAQHDDLIANIGTQQVIINRKKRVVNYGHSLTGKCNSLHFGSQMAKIGPEFWPTQRAAIRLGIATHLINLLILQYCIGIASIGKTFFSITRVLQYFLKVGIGIHIANTFIEYWYLIYTNINSQYFSIVHERNLYWELVNVHVTDVFVQYCTWLILKWAVKGLDFMTSLKFIFENCFDWKINKVKMSHWS